MNTKIVVVGSLNPIKILAAETVFRSLFHDVAHGRQVLVRGVAAKSGVREQPLDLDEIIIGACQRARDALVLAGIESFERGTPNRSADLAIGLESGVFTQATGCSAQLFDVCACAILTSGSEGELFVGLSSAWTVPKNVSEMIFRDHIDMDEALFRANLTEDRKIGRADGAVGLLSEGRLTRQAYTQQAIEAALIPWKAHEKFRKKERGTNVHE